MAVVQLTSAARTDIAVCTSCLDNSKHCPDLDGLRGLLAFSILLLHYGINALMQRITDGYFPGFVFQLSVDFFFILSGYVLTRSLGNGPVDMVGFAIKRAFRLLPIHYVTLAGMVILAAVAARSVPYLALPLLPGEISSDVFLMTPVFWGDPINMPAWSVTWELFLPIGAIALTRPLGGLIRRWSVPILIALACGTSVAAYAVAGGGYHYGPRAFMGLLAGACLYISYDRLPIPRWLFRSSTIYALVAAMVIVMLVAASYQAAAVLFPWLALMTILSGTRTRSLLSSQPMMWLGGISYTLYMVHVPVLVAAVVLLGDITISPATKAVAVIASLAVATLLTATVERWGMDLGRAITHRRRRLAVQFAAVVPPLEAGPESSRG